MPNKDRKKNRPVPANDVGLLGRAHLVINGKKLAGARAKEFV
jgi:hypothetical protein